MDQGEEIQDGGSEMRKFKQKQGWRAKGISYSRMGDGSSVRWKPQTSKPSLKKRR